MTSNDCDFESFSSFLDLMGVSENELIFSQCFLDDGTIGAENEEEAALKKKTRGYAFWERQSAEEIYSVYEKLNKQGYCVSIGINEFGNKARASGPNAGPKASN